MAVAKEMMQARYRQFCSIKDTAGLAGLLKAGEALLYRLRFEKPYQVFTIRKSKGKTRLIEAPGNELKPVLRNLNEFLQSCYFFNASPVAYGFVQQPRNCNRKRNILTNAKRHTGRKYLLNIDFEDFFHQVSKMKVVSIFRNKPFEFQTDLSSFLSELATFRNRLPMGSPVSPVLSNFSCLELDREILTFSKQSGVMFTRYVDDLSFSSDKPITPDFFNSIEAIIKKHSFRLNREKIKWMGEGDEKVVTGLILAEKPVVSQQFIQDLEQNIKRFKHIMEFSAVAGSGVSEDWLDQFRQHLAGKIRFMQMVYGTESPVYRKLASSFSDAFNVKSFAESFSWNNFPYYSV